VVERIASLIDIDAVTEIDAVTLGGGMADTIALMGDVTNTVGLLDIDNMPAR
jgi:hypothetical protein